MFDPANPYASPLTLVAPPPPAPVPLRGPIARVATGLGFIFVGTALMSAGLVVLPALGLLNARPDVRAMEWVGVLWLIGGLLNFVGSLFCLMAPRETGGRELIFSSVGAGMIVALMVFIRVLERMQLVAPLPVVVNAVTRLLIGVTAVTFMLFLWRLNHFVGRQTLARCSAIAAVYFLTATMVQLGLESYLSIHPEALHWMPDFLFIGLLACYAAGLSVCAVLCRATRRAILASATVPASL
jgi:hypothetical protein